MFQNLNICLTLLSATSRPMKKFTAILFLALSVCIGMYTAVPANATADWQTGYNDFRETEWHKGILTDRNLRSGYDVVNVTGVHTPKGKIAEITLKIANRNNHELKRYPAYRCTPQGKRVEKASKVKRPVWGAVWGYADRNNYHAICFRRSRNRIYDMDIPKLQVRIFTVCNGDTTVHRPWSDIEQSHAFDTECGFNRIRIAYTPEKGFVLSGGIDEYCPLGICPDLRIFGDSAGIYVGSAACVALSDWNVSYRTYQPDVWQTGHTYESLKARFAKSQNKLEGFWNVISDDQRINKNVHVGGEYKFAFVADSTGGYDLVYLSGAERNRGVWKEGYRKGKFFPTGNPNIFEAEWYDAAFRTIKPCIVTIDRNEIMELIFQNNKVSLFFARSYQRHNVPDQSREYNTSGSGFVIDPAGLIVTNHHVIDNASKVWVRFPTTPLSDKEAVYAARVIGCDQHNDLAVLQITDSTFTRFPDLPFGIATDLLEQGSSIFCLGFPRPDMLGNDIKYSEGIITSLNTSFNAYHISADADHGSSGGAMFDKENGNITGVTSSMIDQTHYTSHYAIKSPYIVILLQSLGLNVPRPVSTLKGLPSTEKIKLITPYCCQILCKVER